MDVSIPTASKPLDVDEQPRRNSALIRGYLGTTEYRPGRMVLRPDMVLAAVSGLAALLLAGAMLV